MKSIKKIDELNHNRFILSGSSSLQFVEPETEDIHTYRFKGSISGIQVNKERESIMMSHMLFAKSNPFNYYSGIKEILKDGSIQTYNFSKKGFKTGRSFYTYDNYIVSGGSTYHKETDSVTYEVRVFDIFQQKFVHKIPVKGDKIHVTGVNERVIATYYNLETQIGSMIELNLNSLTSSELKVKDFHTPDILYIYDDNVYGLYLNAGLYISSYEKKVKNTLVKFDENYNIIFEIKLPIKVKDFVVQDKTAYVIAEKDHFFIVNVESGQQKRFDIGREIWLKDIKIINDHIYILGTKVYENFIFQFDQQDHLIKTIFNNFYEDDSLRTFDYY